MCAKASVLCRSVFFLSDNLQQTYIISVSFFLFYYLQILIFKTVSGAELYVKKNLKIGINTSLLNFPPFRHSLT